VNVGVLGCGLIGGKRCDALPKSDVVAAVFDPNAARAQALAKKTNARACESVDEVLRLVDVVVIATTNDQLAPLTRRALEANKHVVVEKPGARDAAELRPIVELAAAKQRVVKVGFNHRFHPAIQKARAILEDADACGPVMFVRARYGHGGRIGYDKEWRANPAISGGGELIDQGVHLIDLARWFMGAEFTSVTGRVATFFWNMPVDDNAFMTLADANGRVAHLHASCTEWKNLFSFEIYAKRAKLHIEGLGGSYGVERLYHYAMTPEMGPPPTTIYEYPGKDTSWELEWADFKRAVESGAPMAGDLRDALATLEIVDKLYGR
jgi:predicted dehydrogenase